MNEVDVDLLGLLEESGLEADDELADLLGGLRALGTGPVPEPSSALSALLIPETGRRRFGGRGALIGALVVLSIGSGVTAAAASPAVRDGAVGAVAAVAGVLHPHATAEHSVPVPTPRPAPARAVAPARPVPSVAAVVPVGHPSTPPSETEHRSGRSQSGGDRGRASSDDRSGSRGSSGSSHSGSDPSRSSGASGSSHGSGSAGNGDGWHGDDATGGSGKGSGDDAATGSGKGSGSADRSSGVGSGD